MTIEERYQELYKATEDTYDPDYYEGLRTGLEEGAKLVLQLMQEAYEDGWRTLPATAYLIKKEL